MNQKKIQMDGGYRDKCLQCGYDLQLFTKGDGSIKFCTGGCEEKYKDANNMREKTIKNETKPYYFKEGNPGGPGRPKMTEEQKIIKKAVKEYIAEYEESLSETLPELSPVLKKMALGGDIQAIKELHDVVGLKKRGEGTMVAVQVNVSEDRSKYQ